MKYEYNGQQVEVREHLLGWFWFVNGQFCGNEYCEADARHRARCRIGWWPRVPVGWP